MSLISKTEEATKHDVFTYTGLLDAKDEYPNALSGGQKQRIALARSIYGSQVPDAALNYVWDASPALKIDGDFGPKTREAIDTWHTGWPAFLEETARRGFQR